MGESNYNVASFDVKIDPASIEGSKIGPFDPASIEGSKIGPFDPASLGGSKIGEIQIDPGSLGASIKDDAELENSLISITNHRFHEDLDKPMRWYFPMSHKDSSKIT